MLKLNNFKFDRSIFMVVLVELVWMQKYNTQDVVSLLMMKWFRPYFKSWNSTKVL